MGERTTTVYNAAGQVEAAIDAAIRRTTFLYDAAGNQTTVIDYSGGRTTTAYNAAGQVESITKPTGERTTFIYDSAGRQTETIDYFGGRTTTVYDAAGQAIATVNPLGKRTTTVYDDAGRTSATVDQLNNRTTFVYDAAGNRTLYQDALNNKTTFVYDSLQREIERIDPHGQSVTFAYDAAGYMTSTTNRLALRRDFSFDDVGRKTGETWIDDDGSTVVDRITFTYDAAGNQLTAANGAGAYTFTYDDLNRVSTVQEPFGISLTFTWDALGRRTKLEDSFGGVTTSVYDVLNQLENRRFGGTSQTPLRIDLTYTVEGQQQSFTRYSDLSGTTKVATTSFTYDAAQRLTNLHHFDGSNNNIANYTYTYDAHSRLTVLTRNGTPVTYTYDDTDQVTGDGTATFTYDAEGNRTNEGYSTGTGNQLTSDGTWNYTYDDEGNLTKKVKISDGKTWTYGYDHRNQIIQVQRRTTDGGTLELDVDFKYDAYGNRLEKAVDSDGDGNVDTTQRYALDGWNTAKPGPIGTENWDVVFDLDGSNNLVTRYLRGDVVDQLFARTAANGDAYWYFGDHLGSIRDITDNTGVVKDTLSYDAFGNIISESDANYGGRYKWTGREIDQEIELQYNRARYYDAKIGRWISQDPLGFEAGDSNLYRYVNNKPTNVRDPSGLARIHILIIGFIPEDKVTYSGRTFKGDNRDFVKKDSDPLQAGYRARLLVDFDTKTSKYTYDIEAQESIEYDALGKVIGRETAKKGKELFAYFEKRFYTPVGIEEAIGLSIKKRASNPLVKLAPAIGFDILVDFECRGKKWSVNYVGAHTGYPNFEVFIKIADQKWTPLYKYSHGDRTPAGLFRMEKTIKPGKLEFGSE